MNLTSMSQLCGFGYFVQFSSTSCHVQDPQSQRLIRTGCRQGGLYVMDELWLPWVPDVAILGANLSSLHLASSFSSFYLWHFRLGHVLALHLEYLISKGSLGNLQTHDIYDYSGCKLARFFALPFNQCVSSSFTWFILMCGDLSLLPQNGGLDIMSLLLMITLDIVGFIWWRVGLILYMFILIFTHLLKLNTLLLSSVFVVIWVKNMHP